MSDNGFSLPAAPLVCLLALQRNLICAAPFLTFVVTPDPSQWGARAGLPAATPSSEPFAAYFQSAWQEWALVLTEAGLIALLTATAVLGAAFLSRLRRRAEGALRERERDYRNLFEQAHDAIIVFLPEREIVIDVNERACEMYGYGRAEFVGMSLEDISKSLARGKDMIKETLRTGGYLNFETVQYRRDGTEMFLEINASAISYQGQTAILSINRDVTERVRAERALRQAEKKYRGIFENAVEGIFQSTPDGQFISVNPAMARMFGFDSPEQMIAERADIERQHYVNPRRRAERRRMIEERGVVRDFVAEVYRRDGSTLWTSSNTRAVRDEQGEVRYYEGFLQDITDRVRADEWEIRQKRMTALRADVITAFAAGGAPLRDILRQSAEAIVKHLDAAFARVWTLNQAEGVLELQASAGLYTQTDGSHARIPVGSFKVGLIAEERTPHLTNDVQEDERIADKEWARREGIVAFAGYPLMVEGRMVGVMAMFARRPLRQDALDALSLIADTIAQGVERVRAETALRDSEQKFRRLIQELHVGFLLLGPGTEVLLSNESARKMLGLTEDQLMRKTALDPDWDMISESGAAFPCEACPVARAIDTRAPVRDVVMGVYRPLTRDRVWLLVNADPQLGDEGTVTHVVCTFSDITERKRAEDEVRRQKEILQKIFDNVPLAITFFDEGGRLLLVNRAWERMFGWTLNELERRNLDPFVEVLPDPRERQRAFNFIAAGTGEWADFEARARDGRAIDIWAAAVRLSDGTGIGLVQDITARKRAEEALRQSEERNRALLKAVPDLIFLQTRDGVYLDYHAKDVTDLLVPPDSFMGKNMREVLPPELAEEFASCFEIAARTGGTQVCEYTIPVGGRERSYEARVVSCDGDQVLTVVRDVTAHRQAEAQRRQLLGRLVNAQEEERARLAREVHDEFAAYLSALKWGLESLKRVGGLPARAESESSYLLGLTAQLQHKVRDFAFELSPAELDNEGGLPAALERYVTRWAERAGDRLEAEFRRVGFDGRRRLPREVEIAIYRVTQEALTNVLKHAEARRVRLTLGFYMEEPGRAVVSLIVEDDGAGFVPELGEGAERGLGLKGMGERMALLGGTLEVRSGSEGTTLIVSVPVSIPHEGEGNG